MSSKTSAGRTRSKASGESDPVETDSPAKKQRSIAKADYDPDLAKDEELPLDGKNPSRVEAGKKAAETRRRNASKSGDDDQSGESQEDDQSNKKSSHSKMQRAQDLKHEQHVEAGKKGAEARWGKDSTEGSSGKDESESASDELAKDPKIQALKKKQNAERGQEIKECQQLIQQATKQSAKPDLALLMDPKGKNLIQVIRMEHRLVEQLGEQLTSMLKQSSKESNEAALGLAFNIMKLLSIHAACEEMVIYPMLKAKGHDALVKHALEEHTQMKQDLVDLNEIATQPDQADFMKKLQKCLDDTLHHVTEEEEALLPLVESINSEAEMAQMLVQFLEGHMKSPTRPHVSAPNEPPTNLKMNAEAAKKDMQMDIDEARFEIPAM